jgi:hypothetical protein
MADKPAADKTDAPKAPKKKSPGMEKLAKNHFWILTVVVVIIGAVVWYLGTGALDVAFAKDQKTAETAFSMAKRLRGMAGPNSPPNSRYAGKVDVVRRALTDEVIKAWEDLYNRQTGVFTVNPKVEIFRDFVLMEPDDRKAAIEANQNLQSNILAAIQTYHNNQVLEEDFEKLFEPLNIRRPRGLTAFGKPVAGAAAAPGGGAADGIVVWRAAFTPTALMQRYDTKSAPSLDRIAVTYEDIWTFRSLFGVIGKMNEKPIDAWLEVMQGKTPAAAPVDQANVPIKRIDYCDIAQYAMASAVADAGNVQIQAADAASAAAGGGDFGVVDAGGGGGAFAVGTEGSPSEDQRLLTDRYVDGRNTPVADPSNPPYTEFRQMFVQLTVLMDQRLVPVLIAQCANAPIPIETRQVRISLNEVDRIRRVNAEDAAAQIEKVEQSPHDATVTLRGIVFIYTKNDPKMNPEETVEAAAKRKLGRGADPKPGERDFGVPKRGAGSTSGTEAPAF